MLNKTLSVHVENTKETKEKHNQHEQTQIKIYISACNVMLLISESTGHISL
jgi:hypothetical protein